MPRSRSSRYLPLMAAICTCWSLSAPEAAAILVVSQPWVRLSPDQRSAEIYMELKSTDGAVLVGVASFAANVIGFKSPSQNQRAAREIALPANVVVQLAPAGFRITLSRFTKPPKLGDLVPIILKIRNADGTPQEISVNAEVRLRSALEDELHVHKH